MIPFISELFSGGGKLLEGARSIIDEVVTSKEEKAELTRKWEQMLLDQEKEIMKAEYEDRASARNREIEVSKTGSRNITQNLLAYIGVGSFFAITGYILSKGLGNMNTEESFIIGNLTGMAGAIAKDIYGYYFGSSKTEHDRQDKQDPVKPSK